MPKNPEESEDRRRTTISFVDRGVLKAAERKWQAAGYTSFSAYVEALLAADSQADELDPDLVRAVLQVVKNFTEPSKSARPDPEPPKRRRRKPNT